MNFDELNLAPAILKAVREQGYDSPTPIQAQAIPAVLAGQDLLAGAQTGTGKTAAFTLPMLHKLSMSRSANNRFGVFGVRALVLTPTRELAAQVEESVRNYGKYLKMETSRLIADFDATRRSRAASKSANKDVIGRLDIGGGESIGAPSGNTATVESATYATTDASENFLKKLPAWAVPTAIGVISVLLLVGLAGAVASCARAKSDAANAAAIVSPIKIYASGNVLVSVQDVATSQSLYAGTLKKGDEKTIETAGEVLIKYSDGSLLEVEKDGKRYKMATSGAGKRVFK